MPFHLIILVFAFVLAVVGAFYNPPRCTLGWLAVACLALAQLVPQMCTVSVVTGYGQRYPDDHWNTINQPPFQALIRHAEVVDKELGEPDCIDPEKDVWMKRIEDRIRRLEQGEPALSGAGQPEWEVG